MNLRDYVWSRNPRGLANEGPFKPFYLDRFTTPRMGWALLIAGADEYLEEAASLIERSVTPVLRLQREGMAGQPTPADQWRILRAYHEAGLRWFEPLAAPNFDSAWPLAGAATPGQVTWSDRERCIRPLMLHWLDWAEELASWGAYPAFPMMAASAASRSHSLRWIEACLDYLYSAQAERFSVLLGQGLWLAFDAQIENLYYQEPPGGPAGAARPYYQQHGDQPGWHFEYPLDPITGAYEAAAPLGLLGAASHFQNLLRGRFQAGPIPALATRGGIPLPTPLETTLQPFPDYPPIDRESQAEALIGLWNWIATEGPGWLFGVLLADEHCYYDRDGRPAPAIARMANAVAALCQPPDLETLPSNSDDDDFSLPGWTPPGDNAASQHADAVAQDFDIPQDPVFDSLSEASTPMAAGGGEASSSPHPLLSRLREARLKRSRQPAQAKAAPVASSFTTETPPAAPPPDDILSKRSLLIRASQRPRGLAGMAHPQPFGLPEPRQEIHAVIDQHWLLIDTSLPFDWIMQSAWSTWEASHPVIMRVGQLRGGPLLSPRRATLIAREGSDLRAMLNWLAEVMPLALIDVLTADDPATLRAALYQRQIEEAP